MKGCCVVGLLAAVVGCQGPAAPDVVRRTVGDTTFVVSPSDGIDGPVALRELRRAASSAIGVNRVEAGTFGPGGTVWLFDAAGANGATVQVLDSMIRPLTVAGREGAGPGEYHAPLRIFRLANGTMFVKEMWTTRAIRFDADGRVLGTLTLPDLVRAGWVVTPDTIGGWYITASFEENTPARVGRYGWLHFGPDGVVTDTVFPPARFLDEPTPSGLAPGRIRTVDRRGAVLTTVPGPNRLTKLGPGTKVWIAEWGGEPAAYGEDERRDAQRMYDQMNDMLKAPRAALPARKQPVNRILTDRSGLVWAQLSTPGVPIPATDLPPDAGPLTPRWREPDRWAAFTSDGVLRFIVDLPASARLLDREDDRLLGMVADSTGDEAVVVWRVTPLRRDRR